MLSRFARTLYYKDENLRCLDSLLAFVGVFAGFVSPELVKLVSLCVHSQLLHRISW